MNTSMAVHTNTLPGQRRGVESFLLLLAIAIILIAAMYSFSYFAGPPGSQNGGEFHALEEFSPGIIGLAHDVASRTVSLGTLTVGRTQEELLKEVLAFQVSHGLLGEETESFPVAVSRALLQVNKGAKIRFTVQEAAPLGNLVITWNGLEVYNAVPSGFTEFQIPADAVKGENTVVLRTQGPGLQFWSSTLYKITNFRVLFLSGPQKIIPFELLPSELQAFDRAEVSFFGSGAGILTAAVNSFPIYSRLPTGPQKLIFNLSSAPLNAGNNVLSFVSTGENVLSGAVLQIFSLSPQLVKQRSFTLSQDDISALSRGGTIEFTIDSFIRSGVLKLTLNSRRLDIQVIQKGVNTVLFTAQDVHEGTNVLEFSGTGAWDIPSVRIGY